MIQTEVLIVGGGPAGSACAWRLRQHDVACLILDQVPFPRHKPCAGWITPRVVRDLNLDPGQLPFGFTTFTSFQVAVRGLHFKLPTRQHAIRRFEFDDWLVRRSGAPVRMHAVKAITPGPNGYDVDGEFFGKYLVGAGGTACPVYRSLFQEAHPRPRQALIVALEEEFPYAYADSACRLWFLENHLPGYSWYVPKVNGYLNVGIGGSAAQLKARGEPLKSHWNLLLKKLDRLGLVRDHDFKPVGHSYYQRYAPPAVRRDNAFLVGDAAGLATLDMGEGISPAIQSGLLAAEAILGGSEYSLASIPRYSLPSMLRLRPG